MHAAEFAAFWRMQGHRVLETKQCQWYSPQPFCFMSIPFHRVVAPSRREIAQVLLRGPSLAIRYPTPPDADSTGGLFIVADRDYDFPSLHQKARNQTRRGLESCKVEQVGWPYLAEQGYAVNAQTLERQGRNAHSTTQERWNQYCQAAAQIPGFEAWAALVEGSLAAFMVTALVEDCFSILLQASAADYLSHNPNNALVFTVLRTKLASPEVGYVSYGLKSIEDTAGVDHFKERMGFQLRPFKEGIVIHPALKPFLLLGGRSGVAMMARRRPDSDFWRKALRAVDIATGAPHA